MTTSTVTLLLALLAVAAQAAVVTAVLLAVARRWSARLRRWGDQMVAVVGPDALVLALAVALVAVLGSLYLSEVAHFVPCKLCWYQRIAMYPLVPVLAAAAWRQDVHVRWYAVPAVVTGASLSSYHMLLERFPSLDSDVCDPANPCSLIWVRRFGYLTIPTMALSAFALILTLVLVATRHAGDDVHVPDPASLQELR